jgi:type II secretory pathway component PulK
MMRQRGTTLIVVLVMLVVLTLLAVAGMRMSTSSLQIVGNMQARKFVDNIASQAVEDVMNSIVPFNAPTGPVTLRSGGTTVSVNTTPLGTATTAATFASLPSPAGVKVAVYARNCLASTPAAGYSAVQPIVPEDNLWEFSVLVKDDFTQATTMMVQGAKIRQLAGSCT